jgi:hypothetical protein
MAVAFVGLGAVLLPLVVGTPARTASGFMTKFCCREVLRFLRNLSLAFSRVEATEREPNARECNWTTLFLGDINTRI